MSNFTIANLTGERALIKGTDRFGVEGQTVVSTAEWTEVKRHLNHHEAAEEFDAKVMEFFAPLMTAAEQLQDTLAKPKVDPITYVVIHEGTEGVQGRDEVAVKLSPESVVLRLIESGDSDRLVWVGDKLEVLEVLDLPTGDEDFTEPSPVENQIDAAYAGGPEAGE